MIPPVTLLTSIVTGLVAKLGIAQIKKHGYMPQSTYVNEALKALEKDDLDEAIRCYRLAIAKKKRTNRTEITHEIISSAIDLRITKLQNRMAKIEELLYPPVLSRQFWLNLLPRQRSVLESLRQEQAGCNDAVAVLYRIKGQLSEDHHN